MKLAIEASLNDSKAEPKPKPNEPAEGENVSPNVPSPSPFVVDSPEPKPVETSVIDTSDYQGLDESGQRTILESSILGYLQENSS